MHVSEHGEIKPKNVSNYSRFGGLNVKLEQVVIDKPILTDH